MEISRVMWLVETTFTVLACMLFLWLQIKGFQRHKHSSFLILAIGSGLSIVYYAAAFAMFLTPMSPAKLMGVSLTCFVLGTASTLLTLIGIIQLFRSYTELANKLREPNETSITSK